MGIYINPGNEGFAKVLEGRYVDKTGLIARFDETLGSADALVMVSRPRRFGKSYAAKALTAFYSCGADSRSLFEGLEVSHHEGWDAHLNAYNVVFLDMTKVIQVGGSGSVTQTLDELLLRELREMLPGAGESAVGPGEVLTCAFLDVLHHTGRPFVFVIDEWDAPYRLAKGDRAAQDAYAEWLRDLFKNSNFTPAAVEGAYLTGILPIKKYAHQSAVSDFDEYTMLSPAKYAPYVGFLPDEVEALCRDYAMDPTDVRRWYDGYRLHYSEDLGAGSSPRFRDAVADVYAPYSLMRAFQRRQTGSYWPSTESFETLRTYVDMDFDGLQRALLDAIGGNGVRVDVYGFQNDLVSMRSSDDVLTLLIHLGYLVYDEATGVARVPNEEVRLELKRAIDGSRHQEVARILRSSQQLVDDILAGNEGAVAAALGRAHDELGAPLFYNSEQALCSVVRSALVAAADDWVRVEELPGGKGYADIVYLPRAGSGRPALLVELKWDKPVQAAIGQIHDRNYPASLRSLGVPLVLAGVTYDTQSKEHSCRIEVTD